MRSWFARYCGVLAMSCAVTSGMAMADEQKPAESAPAAVPAAPAETAPAAAAAAAAAIPAQPQHVHRVAVRPAKQTFFQRVMELERRKNAWLMRTLFGR